MDEKREPVRRISISLPESLYQQFERLVDRRGFRSRSQAFAAVIASSLAEGGAALADAGGGESAATLTLCYDSSGDRVGREVARLRRRHRLRTVGALLAQLAGDDALEMVLLRGPAEELAAIADEYATLRGMRTAKLAFVPGG